MIFSPECAYSVFRYAPVTDGELGFFRVKMRIRFLAFRGFEIADPFDLTDIDWRPPTPQGNFLVKKQRPSSHQPYYHLLHSANGFFKKALPDAPLVGATV